LATSNLGQLNKAPVERNRVDGAMERNRVEEQGLKNEDLQSGLNFQIKKHAHQRERVVSSSSVRMHLLLFGQKGMFFFAKEITLLKIK
jgi:hypothetical protein